MITSQGMLVCSFNLKQRFSRGEENVYPLNQQYELKLENETLRIEDAAKFFQIFCQENSKFTDDTIKMKLFSVKENSFCKIVRDTYTAVSFVIKSGGYGVEGEITDRTSQVVTYHRKENESDVKEFGILMVLISAGIMSVSLLRKNEPFFNIHEIVQEYRKLIRGSNTFESDYLSCVLLCFFHYHAKPFACC